MPRGKVLFKERDLARAIRAAAKSGAPLQRVEIDREGRIVIIVGAPQEREKPGENEWDAA